MYEFVHSDPGLTSHKEWKQHRAIALILASCVPIITTVILYFKIGTYGKHCFKFIYIYDDLQQQECDNTYLVDIWNGKNILGNNITNHIKLDWEKLNDYFEDPGTYGYDPG